ncbi:MAG: indole-3-glycerol phosphate synthase TrpC [Bacteroidetes bacterium]|nr:indole-3-glycerol phosphate synthase TrpC [Bacteroidota bacterium]MCH8524143.1 indole-3-glycerol phosphate synthase TrpC [Balneolales bacterium]
MNILEKITTQTHEDILKRKKKISFTDFRSFEDYERQRKSLYESLMNTSAFGVRVIAEIKKASPSKGVIRIDFQPELHAEQYMKAGASAISVLTDEPFFQGHLNYMRDVSRMAEVPVLRKDFIIDPYQVEEAKAFGADAVLLIATITSESQLNELHHAATEAGLECLVECYSKEDFAKVSFNQVRILGTNNRNLNTFEVDVHKGIALLQEAPDGVCLVSESGLSSTEDLQLLQKEGIHAALIGEYFMKAADPGKELDSILEPLRVQN